METESFFSGYCRQLDDSRMVEVITQGATLLEVDCCFETCVHAPNCTIAERIRQLLEQANR